MKMNVRNKKEFTEEEKKKQKDLFKFLKSKYGKTLEREHEDLEAARGMLYLCEDGNEKQLKIILNVIMMIGFEKAMEMK